MSDLRHRETLLRCKFAPSILSCNLGAEVNCSVKRTQAENGDVIDKLFVVDEKLSATSY